MINYCYNQQNYIKILPILQKRNTEYVCSKFYMIRDLVINELIYISHTSTSVAQSETKKNQPKRTSLIRLYTQYKVYTSTCANKVLIKNISQTMLMKLQMTMRISLVPLCLMLQTNEQRLLIFLVELQLFNCKCFCRKIYYERCPLKRDLRLMNELQNF